MPLWICERSCSSPRAVRQSRVKALGRVSVMGLVKVPPLSMLVVNSDTLHAGPAWTDGSTSFIYAADNIRYHAHLGKERNGLLDDIHYLSDFKLMNLQPESTSQGDLDPLLDAVCGESLAVEEASTETPAPPKR